jgi:tetratricopeptide (TPR) repeat protein
MDASIHVLYANRANAYLEAGMNKECIEDCQKVLEMEPTFAKAYYRWARALVNQEKLQEALEVLDRC